MKRTLATLTLALAITASAFAQTTWTVDNIHSKVMFSVTHLVISEVDGSFKVYDGVLTSTPDFFRRFHQFFGGCQQHQHG